MHFNAPRNLKFFGKADTLHSKHVDSLTGSLPQEVRRHPEKSWFLSLEPVAPPFAADNFKTNEARKCSSFRGKSLQCILMCSQSAKRWQNAEGGKLSANNYIEKMKGPEAAKRNKSLCNPFKSRLLTFLTLFVKDSKGRLWSQQRDKINPNWPTNKTCISKGYLGCGATIMKFVVYPTHLSINFLRQFSLCSRPLFAFSSYCHNNPKENWPKFSHKIQLRLWTHKSQHLAAFYDYAFWFRARKVWNFFG